MAVRTPLQIVVSRDADDRLTDVYVDTLRAAFEGNTGRGSASAYLDDAVDLGFRVLEPSQDIAPDELDLLLTGAERTIGVAIGESTGWWPRLADRIPPDRAVRVDAPPRPSSGPIQQDRGPGPEREFAPVVAALRAMECARRSLAEFVAPAGGLLKLFISHGKVDGLAMAKSLIGVLRQLQQEAGDTAGFEYFYDAEHLEPGSMWAEVLDAQAGNAILVALRTEAYESRHWCRREFLAAESNGMPIVAVDLRKEQFHDSALLPFDAVPTVRLHDGNLIRVILHAMGTHLRALGVQSQAPDIKVLPHRPTLYSLAGPASDGETIAYPGPRVADSYRDALEPLLRSGGQLATLLTFDELR